MSRSSTPAATLAAVSVLAISIFLLWPDAPRARPPAAAEATASFAQMRATEAANMEARYSDAADLRVATLELELDALRGEVEALRDTLASLSTDTSSDGRAEPEPARHASAREERTPGPEELERVLEEEALAANVRVLDAEARFAGEAPDMPAAGQLRDRLEAGFAEHDLLAAAIESFECGRSTCRAELRFDDPQERALGDAILPMLLGVEGQVEVYPDEGSGRLLVFAERHRS
jgi:TolA-binding protein